ncbi:hypothetical protein M446_5510 [Methylobacterium sp. 4-46]|uniref:hypothetical protein n=1 Tax=unclassified Methylobacterium TaxID=2615210 RepID=UPI000152D86E|nr:MULTISPECIES: hypothetical protein [Methylobacterium]ACA19826.1 hypothetical protein M446_5510 [Methylobacterium sp. 4-46]WFT79011.1 hypothetical protein QA634_27755 [Methylobacterium nodulans]
MRRGLIALGVIGVPLAAAAEEGARPRRLQVREGALLCVSPFSFAVAAKAAQDPGWLAENGCLVAKPGLAVLRLGAVRPVAGGPAWNVRVTAGGPAGLVVWGRPQDFRLESGEPVPQDY